MQSFKSKAFTEALTVQKILDGDLVEPPTRALECKKGPGYLGLKQNFPTIAIIVNYSITEHYIIV